VKIGGENMLSRKSVATLDSMNPYINLPWKEYLTISKALNCTKNICPCLPSNLYLELIFGEIPVYLHANNYLDEGC
jgi:hypothetical protein